MKQACELFQNEPLECLVNYDDRNPFPAMESEIGESNNEIMELFNEQEPEKRDHGEELRDFEWKQALFSDFVSD